jgi:hypothetical protein
MVSVNRAEWAETAAVCSTVMEPVSAHHCTSHCWHIAGTLLLKSEWSVTQNGVHISMDACVSALRHHAKDRAE